MKFGGHGKFSCHGNHFPYYLHLSMMLHDIKARMQIALEMERWSVIVMEGNSRSKEQSIRSLFTSWMERGRRPDPWVHRVCCTVSWVCCSSEPICPLTPHHPLMTSSLGSISSASSDPQRHSEATSVLLHPAPSALSSIVTSAVLFFNNSFWYFHGLSLQL